MKRISLLFGALLFVASSALASEGPQKALPLEDGNVVSYGARMRVTKTAWDFALLTIRDNFRNWTAPDGTAGLGGANLLLDPGYDFVNHGAAGFVRTTPFLWDYVRYDSSVSKVNWGTISCGSCVSGSCNASRTCGGHCTVSTNRAPSNDGYTNWTQCRRVGSSLSTNQPPLPPVLRSASRFREYGFYVAGAGADFSQLQFCTNRGGDGDFYFDSGSGKSGPCQDARKTFTIGSGIFSTDVHLYYNVRLMIYPNMRTEYMGVSGTYPRDPKHSWENWNPGTNRGSYCGLTSSANLLVSTMTGCTNSPYCTSQNVDCYCLAWVCCDRHYANCGGGAANMQQWIRRVSLSSHNALSGYNERDGSYKRQGDDMALYTNIGEMQIHSYNRNTFLGYESSVNRRACGYEKWYNGTNNGTYPNYSDTYQKIANCMYPKSYWDFGTSRWKHCNPFDTWNADGTLNPANDDAKFLYPGNPNTGANPYGTVSPGRCGRQTACTWGSCNVNGTTGTYQPGSYTTRFDDLFVPGGGWHLLRVLDLRMVAGTNPPTSNINTHPRMEIDLRIPDVRAELAAAVALRTQGTLVVDQTYKNIRAQGQIKMNSLDVGATVRIFSIDETSCTVANAATCADPYTQVNDNNKDYNKLGPDKLRFDIQIGTFSITSPNPWYVGSCDNVKVVLIRDPIFGADIVTATISACDILNDDLYVWGIHIGSVGIKDMLEGIVEDALRDEIKGALGDFVAAVPNLNGVLGDPINLACKSLIESGIYITGGMNERVVMPDGTSRWPVAMLPGPSADREITDLKLSLGFKPMAFRPPTGIYNVMDVDINDPPLADSVYGVPELWNPSTIGCTSAACSLGAHAPSLDEDQEYDSDDYTKTGTGGYRNPKTNAWTTLQQYHRVPEFWRGPIGEFEKPPAWCSSSPGIGAPRTIRSGGGRVTDFQTLYPRNTWLSFDPARDKAPAGSGMVTPGARNTFGTWDSMVPNTIFRQNMNNGSKETGAVPYDFSLHIHQRTLAQFLQTAVASGMTCIEFAAKDTEGADTPWKSMLTTEAFAAFFPGIEMRWPGKHMKVRISSMGTPRVRTGLGSLSYTPTLNTPVGQSPLPINAAPYMLSFAFPDTRIEFVMDDPDAGDVSLMTLYWTPVVGVHAQSVRKCYYLDPWVNDPRCTSPFVNVRTVSGYYEIYVDLGSDSLKDAWSAGGSYANSKDFPVNYFGDIGSARFFSGAVNSSKSHIVIADSYCDFSNECDQQGISQLLPTLMDSFVSLFVVSRFSFQNLTLDFLYTGVDGPNDDGVGGGDYLGIYARFLGSLDLFTMLESVDTLLAPKNGIEPMAYVPGAAANAVQWFTTNRPTLPVAMQKQFAGDESEIAYTYSLDGGFWKTQQISPKLELGPLLEGEHKLELRAVEHTQHGATASLTPAVVRFRVDTQAPKITIRPSPKGVYKRPVGIDVHDAQTEADQLKTSYQWNDEQWRDLAANEISLKGRESGIDTLRVRSTDLAGNVGESARRVTVGEVAWWACGQAGVTPDAGALLILLVLMAPVLRRRLL